MTTGLDIAVLRTGAVLTPVLLTAALWLAGAGPRCRGAAALATLWNLVGLLVVNALAVAAGAWTFGTTGAMWAGVPYAPISPAYSTVSCTGAPLAIIK